MDHLGAGIGLLVIVGHRDRVKFADAVFAVQYAAWIFPCHRAAGFNLSPAHLAAPSLAQCALGDEIIDAAFAFCVAGIPVLHGRIFDFGIVQRDQFDHSGVQLILVAHRRSAAFEIADIAALVGDDQCPFDLPGIFRVDTEIGRKLHRAAHPFGDVDERAIGKDRAIERGEIIVVHRHNLAEIFADEIRIFLNRFRNAAEDNASPLQFSAEGCGNRNAVKHGINRDAALGQATIFAAFDTGKQFLFGNWNA